MNIPDNNRQGGSESAFTMVEIALCIAIVAFAMVAILGVLPLGMNVQKDNRDDSIIDQEGQFWIEALRSGNRGLDELTNYVEQISVSNVFQTATFANQPGGSGNVLTNGEIIMGLLSMPTIFVDPIGHKPATNTVLARVKALTGLASEKGALTNEFSFRYELQAEITSEISVPTPLGNIYAQTVSNNIAGNLYDVRLIMRWPLYERGSTWVAGNNRKVFRAKMAGTLVTSTNYNFAKRGIYHLRPNTYIARDVP